MSIKNILNLLFLAKKIIRAGLFPRGLDVLEKLLLELVHYAPDLSVVHVELF